MNIQQQITALRDELRQHNYNYYILDNPTISDYDFDIKLKELQALETAHPEFFDATFSYITSWRRNHQKF